MGTLNETKYDLTINPTPVSSKPPKDDKTIGKIYNNLNLTTGLTINQFSTFVSQPYGYTWSGGLFEGKVSNDNWKSQSIFALDFDKGLITIDEVYDRFKPFGIVPQVWYTTFSDSTSLRKFRVVLFIDEPSINKLQHKHITKGLLTLFPEADPVCKNRGRFFFGGLKSYVTNEKPIQLQKIVDSLGVIMVANDGGRTRKINSELFKNSGPNENNGRNWLFLYNNNRNYQILPKKTTNMKGGRMEQIDWSIAKRNVKILDEFLKGRWLYHDELFGLATNMVYINGGRKLMMDTMKKYNGLGTTEYTQNNFNILTYLNVPKYPPSPLYEFSPFKEDHDHYDIISATKDIRGKIEIINPVEKIELSTAEKLLYETYDKIIKEDNNNKIYLLKLPTSIGKTESITKTTNTTISVPTNDLKNEISERMKVDYVTSPDPVVFDDKSINHTLQYYYNIGLPKKSTSVLYNIINHKGTGRYSNNDVEIAEKYVEHLNLSQISNDTVITTHSRAIHTTFAHDTIIFDEDPLNQLIDIKQIQISDLHKLNIQSKNIFTSDLDPVINYLEKSIPTEIKETPTFSIDVDELVKNVSQSILESNIFDFFNSNFFVKDKMDSNMIHYVVKRPLPSNKKIIIMSATIPIYIYKKLFGDRIEVIDINDVKQKGRIIQHTSRSCSRNGLGRYVNSVSDEVGDKPVLTFKSFGNHFKNPIQDMYFGNCRGYDSMMGKDMVVVGTPHRNNIEYFLTAKVLGVNFKTTDTTMSHQKIEYNGFRFKFNCFDNEELRQIQLSLIESDLIQGVGRSRTLRTNARVDLYSNFPLRITDEFIF